MTIRAAPPFGPAGPDAVVDAVVIGAGLNGLAAAVRLAEAGARVLVLERAARVGGAVGSDDALGPGTVRDVGAAVFPFGPGARFFRDREGDLARHGLRWIRPERPLAHPLDDVGDGRAAILERSLTATARALGPDGPAWEALLGPLAERWDELQRDALGPMLRVPSSPLLLARFGARALPPASLLARAAFRGPRARALLAGLAAHANLPLHALASSAPAMVLGALAHVGGWPVPAGGAQRAGDALAARLRELGGEIRLGTEVRDLADVPSSRVLLADVAPRHLARLAGDRLPAAYRRRLERWPHAPGAFKLDLLLDGPAPWRDPAVAGAGTVHLGGTLEEIEASERAPARGRAPARPFVLLAQPSAADPSRAPAGRTVLWAYMHVPNGDDRDHTETMLTALERSAPGLRERVVATTATTAAGLERLSPNLVGGDVGGGSVDLLHLLARPTLSPAPYRTPTRGLYLCSASTPPGGGAHGLCGLHAAEAALARELA